MALTLTDVIQACNVPVFRYALERWQPDRGELIVFFDDPLTDAQESFVRKLESESSGDSGTANVMVIRSEVKSESDPVMRELWNTLEAKPTTSSPYVVVRTKLARGRTINTWGGPLDVAMKSGLLQSPVREELTQRIVAGHSVVWLMLRSNNAKRNRETRDLLQEQLTKIAATVELPQGVGLPGSQLFSEVPLLTKFSLLEIDPTDDREQFMVELLTRFLPDAVAAGEPLLVPVFGRGRALEVIPASELDATLIEDLMLFLCGACSCQVKAQNPGFDLLLTTDWNLRVLGRSSEGFVNGPPTGRGPRPVLQIIPVP